MLLWVFCTLALADGLPLEFQWQQVSSSLLSILTDLNNPVVWMVSTRPLISKSSSPFTNPAPSAPITSGITVTFTFHSFFSSLARSRYLSLFSFSFSFTQWSAGSAKSTIRQVLFIVDYHKVLLSSREQVICLYLKIPKKFVRLINCYYYYYYYYNHVIIIIILLASFPPIVTGCFHWNPNDNKFPQLSSAFNNLADFSSTVVKTVSTLPRISWFSSLFSRFFGMLLRS